MTALVELDYNTYIATINHAELKQQVDDWLHKYDKWITGIAHKAQRRGQLPYDTWQDLKQDMVLQAYSAIDRFDVTRGVPLGTFLIATLWSYPYSRNVRKKYNRMFESSYYADNKPFDHQCDSDDDTSDDVFVDNHEVSSLERANGILSLLDGLLPHETLVMKLHYGLGMQLKQIDEMMGASRSSTFHKVHRIIGKLQEKAVAE